MNSAALFGPPRRPRRQYLRIISALSHPFPVSSGTHGREQLTPPVYIFNHSFKVLRLHFLGLGLFCDGSLVPFFWSSSFLVPDGFPYHACFGVLVDGILKTFAISSTIRSRSCVFIFWVWDSFVMVHWYLSFGRPRFLFQMVSRTTPVLVFLLTAF